MSNSLWHCGLQPTRLLCPWGVSKQEYWSGLPWTPSGDLPNPGMEPKSLMSPKLAGRFFTTRASWEAWRDTWSNRQVRPWNTKWSRTNANRVLPRECAGHRKHPLPITQEMTLHLNITRWSILKSDWLYSLQPKMEKFYTVSKNKTGSWLWLRSWTPYCKIQI